MNIRRMLSKQIEKRLFTGKAIIVYGPRQSGKTTLINDVLANRSEPKLLLSGDEFDVGKMFTEPTSAKLRALTAGYKIVFIDEAQKIPGIGTVLKLFTDMIPDVQVIATGSSAFELADKTKESLTGRKWEFHLFPLSYQELVTHANILEENRMLEQRLIWGSYPEIVTNTAEAKQLVKHLAGSYMFKDILALDAIKNSELLENIVSALALQVGSEVSFTEIAQLTGADKNTVTKYINILEKAFIIFRLPAINRNVRNEIKKGKKFYFYDTGIRNAVIGNFNLLSQRTDVGALWENYIVSERMKRNVYANDDYFPYFWRTTQQQEIDYIEERQGDYFAYEFKWNPKAKAKFSQTFLRNYPVKEAKVITPDNIEEFLL